MSVKSSRSWQSIHETNQDDKADKRTRVGDNSVPKSHLARNGGSLSKFVKLLWDVVNDAPKLGLGEDEPMA